jgi:succinate dehydrogenase / fumarate reductase, iron-sulfur subunit
MKLTVEIRRFDPEAGRASTSTFAVEAEGTDRILDVLLRIKEEQDATLAFRFSCGHGVCGSDAMRINGREGLACKTLVKDVAAEGTVRLEPLRHMPVLRDLVVDQEGFFKAIRSVSPFFLPPGESEGAGAGAAAPAPRQAGTGGREALQSAEEQARFEDATKCISCGACFSACPVLEVNPRFIGPAALVQAARFVEDSRDAGLPPRLEALDTPDGVWACENHFECTRACPREIKVTRLINLLKRRVKAERDARGEKVRDGKDA